jgi:microcystin-dependent protein
VAEPFLAEIRIMSFVFPPKGWALCNGQLLPINQNQALFSLLGTMYGGDGRVNFALPDFRGRAPVHVGGSLNVQGQKGGQAAHTVTVSEMPQHFHIAQAFSQNGDVAVPGGNLLGTVNNLYNTPAANLVALNAATITSVGGSQAHENRMPLLVLSFCIALQGIFPSRN